MADTEGKPFTNGPTCEGVAYSFGDEAQMDFAEIVITGRYPEYGWAMNEEAHEMVKVTEGKGKLLIKDEEAVELTKGKRGYIPAGVWFAWDGDMQMDMVCSPPFDPSKYKTREL